MRLCPRLIAAILTCGLLVLLAGCAPRSPSGGKAEGPVPFPTHTLIPPTARADPIRTRPAATPPNLPTATPEPEAMETAEGSAPYAGREPLFGPDWGDRHVYEAGLVSSQRQVLQELASATEYRIRLEIDDDYTRAVGREQVRYTNTEDTPLTQVYFRLFPNATGGSMEVRDVTVNGRPAKTALEMEETALSVALDSPLQPGESAVIEMGYSITVPESLDTGYGILSYSDGILALDSPYLAIPVYNEEGWNVEVPPENADTSFNDMAFYLVQVAAPEEFNIAAVGNEVDRAKVNGQQVVTYAAGPVRDFYLAGSDQYIVVEDEVGETAIRSYAKPEEASQARVALAVAAGAVESYNRRFAPYPYTELDLVATPMLALGIEYPGVMSIATKLYEEAAQVGDRPVRDVIAGTVAHETAHQWFYNLVGSDQIDEPWLDEATAQYATSLYLLDSSGEAAAQGYRDSWDGRWDRVDRREKPVGLPAADYEGREYSAIVYGRGPIFLHELAERMGGEAFDRFLKRYSEAYLWKIATSADFRRMAEEECECDLGAMFEEWVYP